MSILDDYIAFKKEPSNAKRKEAIRRGYIFALRRSCKDFREVWNSDLLTFNEKIDLIGQNKGAVNAIVRELNLTPLNNVGHSFSNSQECENYLCELTSLVGSIKEL